MGKVAVADNRKAKPTEADLEAAARLRAEWAARKQDRGLTQEKMAERLGGKTQGLVSQYLSGKIPLNYRALLAFSDALGIYPAIIRTDLPEQQVSGSYRVGEASHPARLDPEKIEITTRAINRVLDRRVKGMTLDLTDRMDAEIFAEAYAECDAMPEPTEADMVFVVVDLLDARGGRRGSEGKQAGSTDRSKGRKARPA